VLLGAGSFGIGGECGDNTLWILSVSFLGGSFIVSILVAMAFSKVPFLRRYVSGFRDKAKSLKEVEKDLERRNRQSAPNSASSQK